jgi:hypothetical protein
MFFREIAHKLISFHLGGYYCRSLSNSVCISHDLAIIFPRVPIDNRLSQGIEIDSLHFRCLVAKTMANELNIHKLPMSFEFFTVKLKMISVDYNFRLH